MANKLSDEERTKIAMEVITNNPRETVCTIALAHLAQEAINAGAPVAEMENELTVGKDRYKVKMTVTYQKI